MKIRALVSKLAVAVAASFLAAGARLFAGRPAVGQVGAAPAALLRRGSSATPACPPQNVYHIEIVVFRVNQALGGAENWKRAGCAR